MLMRLQRKPHADHGPDHAHGGHTDAELRAAYERGRREERARHKVRPFSLLSVAFAALIGGAALVLAIVQGGSFERGGALMDRGVATAAREAGEGIRGATAQAGEEAREMTRPANPQSPS